MVANGQRWIPQTAPGLNDRVRGSSVSGKGGFGEKNRDPVPDREGDLAVFSDQGRREVEGREFGRGCEPERLPGEGTANGGEELGREERGDCRGGFLHEASERSAGDGNWL